MPRDAWPVVRPLDTTVANHPAGVGPTRGGFPLRRTDGPKQLPNHFVELNVSTCGADPRNCGGVNRCRQTARRRATSLGRLEISFPPKGRSPCHSYASDASLRDVQFEHSGRATYGDPVRGKRGRCARGSPATSAARDWRDRLQARSARGFAPSKRDKAKTQLHRYMPAARLPPADRPQWGRPRHR